MFIRLKSNRHLLIRMYVIPKISECMTKFLYIFFQKTYFIRYVYKIV